MKRTKAFTLIELVIVIVLLGILAATALPRFVDFGGDAKKSVVKKTHATLAMAVELHLNKFRVDQLSSDTTYNIQGGSDPDIRLDSNGIIYGAKVDTADLGSNSDYIIGGTGDNHQVCADLLSAIVSGVSIGTASAWNEDCGKDFCAVYAGTNPKRCDFNMPTLSPVQTIVYPIETVGALIAGKPRIYEHAPTNGYLN